jgi:methylase of polypeptide subunit release factors
VLTRRERVFSNVLLRNAARALVHLQPRLLGSVSEGYLGVFGIRPFGLPLKYELGPQDSVGNLLLWCGPRHFEPATPPLFHKLARKARVILDIGANTGFCSLVACAANPDCRVLAWEPVPHLCAKLRANIELNKFTARCERRQVALSDHNGRGSL